MLPIRNISYLLPMCCSFWEKCINSQKTGLGCSTPLSFLKLNSYLNTKCLFIAFSHAQFCFSMRNFVFEVKTQTCACEKAIKKTFAFEYEFSLSESLYLAHNEWYVRKLIMDTLCSTCTQQIEIIGLKDKLSESLCTIPYFHRRWNMKTHKTSL